MQSSLDYLRKWSKTPRYLGLIIANKAKFKQSLKHKLFFDYLLLKLTTLILPTAIKKYLHKFPFLSSHFYFFDLDTFVSLVEEIFIENEYHPTKNTKKPNIIDLGSNIGVSVLYFKTLYPSSHLTAFEADPTTFTCLEKNVSSYKLQNVTLKNEAAYDKNTSIDFYIDKNGPGSPLMSTIKSRLPKSRITVPAVKISPLISELDQVHMLKIDIEGAESKVIAELDKNNSFKNISQVAIEYHHHIDSKVDEFSSILKILEKNNFGYQIKAEQKPPFAEGKFEDILIFAYKKGDH